MTEPTIVPQNSLAGKTVGISVSESADLSRLGLSPAHCELAVAELARAIFIAGGRVVYGGRLVEPGYTEIFLDELTRYREDRDVLTLCVPETEHRRLSDDELIRRRDTLSVSAELVCLNEIGERIDIDDRPPMSPTVSAPAALSAMRHFVTRICDARVVVGGQLRGYQGAMPGVIEEALLTARASKPIYVAGGFGGAAAAVSVAIGSDDGTWFPPQYPQGAEENVDRLTELAEMRASLAPDGLSSKERKQLAVSHRPGDISSIIATGLGRLARARP